MKKLVAIAVFGMISVSAQADYRLAFNGKKVICSGEDNSSVVLNAKRTTLTHVVEGESLGSKKIFTTKTDRKTYFSYTSSEGVLLLRNGGDQYRFDGEDKFFPVNCK